MREAQAARAADEDKLTGLPNHAKTLELLDLALAERADDDCTTFALIELNGMEDVTAHHGVLGSDEFVVAIARRLKEALPSHAMCGRIASDEFAVTLTAGPDVDAEAVIRAALKSIARPHWIDTVVRVGAHAGFAQAPRHAFTRGELTRRAELALRTAAKKGPGTIVMFDRSIDTVSTDQKFISRELPRAISANEMELFYQPIVASHGGRIVGVEALLRWTHATRGIIPPATFIPVAEQMGLMDTIAAFVLRRALQEAKRWPDNVYVAVNLSPLQVRDRTIVDIVRSALVESAVAPSRLVLEITEGVLIDNPGRDGYAYQGSAWIGRARRARRFWVRLFQSRLFPAFPARQAQNRQKLRCCAWPFCQWRSDHSGDCGAWPRARFVSPGGGR
jgi:diguanylate cyclase (GGDEF)-like protein